jgi:hypothetical protein
VATAATTPQTDLASLGLAPQPATPSAQDRQLAFLNQTPDKRTVSPDRVAAPASANVLQAGAVISAALITGIRSDLPGQITAQVTENVYDSPTGKILLVPQGTRVIGQYDSGVGFGQRRVLLVWNRLIFPNGRSIVLAPARRGRRRLCRPGGWRRLSLGRAVQGRGPVHAAQRRRRIRLVERRERHRARAAQRVEQHQPDRPADRPAPAQHRTDADHPAGLPRPRDRHPRSRPRTLRRLTWRS